MRKVQPPSVFLTLLLGIVTATVSFAQEASARPKLAETEITAMKSSFYEVERTEIKYQPYGSSGKIPDSQESGSARRQ
jgi:hypothetical protein